MFTPLFIDGVWNTTFESNLKKYCLNTRKTDKGREYSNRGGWQSKDLDLTDKLLQPLSSHIISETIKYSSMFNFISNNFTIQCMWININGYKDYNVPHNHGNCTFSGVYYVDTPRDCGDIVFNKGNYTVMGYDWSYGFAGLNNYNSSNWRLPSKEGQCYIFPSYFEHSVLPNLNKNKERISISFNISND